VLTDLDIPLQSVRKSSVGDVGRADIRAAEAGIAVHQVCLGVQTRPVGIVGDANRRVREGPQQVDGLKVSGAQVAGGDHSQAGPRPIRERRERFFEDADTTPLDE
jgi:hypothetical protein